MKKNTPPILAIIGRSNAGKTTLISSLAPILNQRGYRVAAVKHALHGFEMDKPGKDTHRIREAGAQAVAVVSGKRVALIRETTEEMPLTRIAAKYFADMDLVLAEGYRKSDFPKVEVLKMIQEEPPAGDQDENVLMTIRPWKKSPQGHLSFSETDLASLADLIENRLLKEPF